MFKYIEMQQDDGQFIDISLVDSSPKSIRRHWVLTVDRQGANYGVLQRSKTDESEFDFDIQLPKKMVDVLIAAALKKFPDLPVGDTE